LQNEHCKVPVSHREKSVDGKSLTPVSGYADKWNIEPHAELSTDEKMDGFLESVQ